MEDNVNVNTQMPPDLAAKLDEMRGDRSRSQFIRLLINMEWRRTHELPTTNPGGDQRQAVKVQS